MGIAEPVTWLSLQVIDSYVFCMTLTAVKERHFSLPAAPVKQLVTRSGHGSTTPAERGFPFHSSFSF